ncbi:MAG: hypothetical protein ACC656_00055 [Candidatus Heimdallarchaeota archaeon]
MSEIELKIDKHTTYDFIAQVYNEVTPNILHEIGVKLELKSAYFKNRLNPDKILKLNEIQIKDLIKSIFSIRRVAKSWTDNQLNTFIQQIDELLHGEETLVFRFNQFCQNVQTELSVKQPFDLASEILCFYDPDQYWLWSMWMYEPKKFTGALTLVLDDGKILEKPTYGSQYLMIGSAIEEIDKIATELGIRESSMVKTSQFETYVFLCAVYAVYMYTVLRMRMTKEFNTILPNMIELILRLLRISPIKDITRYEVIL